MKYKKRKKILVAPLNWGLGHATRCIPVINALIKENFEPVLAGDGDSLKLLQKYFPDLKSYNLPSYNIRYTKEGKNLKYRLLFDSPQILKALNKEKQVVAEIITKENISGIISDNRFGVRSDKIPSVYITHQLNVFSGSITFFTSSVHQKIISKFDECWVPDYQDSPNLAGKLSHTENLSLKIKYIGPLSRFDFVIPPEEGISGNKKQDIMVLLSGPEPQRSILETRLLEQLQSFTGKVLFIRGILSDDNKITGSKNTVIINYLDGKALQKAILQSKIVLARSGYSTIMDLEKLNARAFFIPTPGQNEQEYLARYLKEQGIASFSFQKDFTLSLLEKSREYSGFKSVKNSTENPGCFPFEIFQKE